MWVRLIWAFVFTCAALGSICVIITRSYLFRKLRWYLLTHVYWIGRLVCCPLCTTTWLSLFATITLFWMSDSIQFDIVSFLVYWFAMVTFSAPFSAMVYHSFWSMPSEEILLYEKMKEEAQSNEETV
jgi:hypothetical protein